MRRPAAVLCLIAAVLTAGCASGPRPEPDFGNPPPAPAESIPSTGRPEMQLPAGGPRPRWVQPDWWDDHPVARAAAWTGFGVGVGLAAAAVVVVVVAAKVSKEIN